MLLQISSGGMTELSRSVGVALAIPSLPSRWAIGDLGPAAYAFAERLAQAGVRYWFLLPWGPTASALDHSPYNALSAFAGNPLWISPEQLVSDGLCRRYEIERLHPYVPWVNYEALGKERLALLWDCFQNRARWRFLEPEVERFYREEQEWLEEWTLFALLRELADEKPWYQWEAPYRDREQEAIAEVRRRYAQRLRFHGWVQFLFFWQLRQLSEWCRLHGVELVGDFPLFVAHDSADVWSHPEYFLLGAAGNSLAVAGAPPDAFNPEGQWWGQPLYRWEVHQADGFRWWIRRVEHALRYVRWLRFDHFRGYAACWTIPVGAKTAAEGFWSASPGRELLGALQRRWMPLPVIPEDLGTITPDVELLRRDFGLSSMRVLLFAFPSPAFNPHAPHNIGRECVVWTSVHDTPPVRGWFRQSSEQTREAFWRYCGRRVRESAVPREFLRLALQSSAWLAVVSVQDLCGLGEEAQMNRPGTSSGNWRWRLPPGMPRKSQWQMLAEMSALFGRQR